MRLLPKFVRVVAIIFLANFIACAQKERSEMKATPEARRLLGVAQPYQAELGLEPAQLSSSVAARRALAWKIIAKILTPVALSAADKSPVPAWLAYYDSQDLKRIFQKLYADQGPEARAARTAFPQSIVDRGILWNATMLSSLSNWPEERYQSWLSQIAGAARSDSLAGLSRTLYGSAALQHLLANYTGIYGCSQADSDPAPMQPGLSEANFSLCFTSEFPADSVIIKTTWRRADFGLTVPVYDTSATKLTALFQQELGAWGDGERQASPDADHIFTMTNDSGATFRLTGLHIMTKELREWVWISLWWSDVPDSDFGEDRPSNLRDRFGVWKNYKMCVVTDYDDHEALEPDFKSAYPSLSGALAAAKAAVGPRSWCSNPYFEHGSGNHETNCIGCHQQGGTKATNDQIIAGSGGFWDHGREKVRANFPSDYLWSINKDPEHLSEIFRKEVEHYDIYDHF